MPEAIAFAAPRTEDMTKAVSAGVGAGIAGVVEGVVVKMAPEMGAAAPILTWGTLLGWPLLGGLGALVTRGMLGDLFQGIACGGVGILGYSLPEMLIPITGRRVAGGQRQIAAGGVKQLPPGLSVAQRAQVATRSSLEF
ncbi:hypothetical protein ES704_01615 [subsurface metagenome]